MPGGGAPDALSVEAGTSARVKPARWASARRRSAPGTVRTSPARPSSPNTTTSGGRARSVMTDAIARATARSAAGSVTVMPPTAAANICAEPGISTVVRQARTARRRLARAASMPRVCGRGGPGPPPVPGPRSACTSTSNGRRPCRTGTTTLPGTPAIRSPKRSGPGSGTARRPSSRISKMPTSPVGPNRCLTDVRTRSAW